MVIVVSNLRRPGVVLDSSKLAILGNKIAGSIRERTGGRFIVKSTIEGNKIRLTIFQPNPETGKLVQTSRDEQTILAGRISSFLNQNGISHDIKVM